MTANIAGWSTVPSDGQGFVYQASTGLLVPAAYVTGGQTVIANLNLGALTLLTEAITAIGTIQTKVNTLLAESRTAGLLAP